MKYEEKRKKEKYILKISKWIEGRLQFQIHEFESLEESLIESKKHKGIIKIYNDNDELVHSENSHFFDSVYC